MSNSQKKINLNYLLNSENKTASNDKMKGRNYKTFIKRIKVNSSDKFELSVIKNPSYISNQNQNFLSNAPNVNQTYNNNNNFNNLNSQNPNYQSTNFCSEEKINDRYNTHSNVPSENKINEKRAKSGLATSLSHLEILRKNQESRATNLTNTQDSNKIPNSNDTNPSSGSNKIDIKISFNYSKANSLSKNNANNPNITNNNITNNNYSNYYLRYKNLSKPNSNNNLTGINYNNTSSNNYANVNTSINNHCDYLNTFTNLNNSIDNKAALLNASYLSKPKILQESLNYGSLKHKEKGTKLKNNDANISHFNSHIHNSIQQEKLFRKKIINQDSEITSEELGERNTSKLNLKNMNYSTATGMNMPSESGFYSNNLNVSMNNVDSMNKNKPIITNYYAKAKPSNTNNHSLAFNEHMLDKINKGTHSINFGKMNFNHELFKSKK